MCDVKKVIFENFVAYIDLEHLHQNQVKKPQTPKQQILNILHLFV